MLTLQTLLLPTDTDCPLLYYRTSPMLDVGEVLSLDTYYNSLSYTKFRDLTTVTAVTLVCQTEGWARISLCVFDGEVHTVAETEGEGESRLTVSLDTLPEHGFLFLRLCALSPCRLLSGAFITEATPYPLSAAIAICTYRRERFVTESLARLSAFPFTHIKSVLVIDNGGTLSGDLEGGLVHILPNKNLGGSGGFTRGMLEAERRGATHVILMDDDVVLHPECLERMTVFCSLLRKEEREAWFSAAMLPLDEPYLQFEMGATWNGRKSIVHKGGVDLASPAVLLDNLQNDKVGYGGWWTLCMPLSVLKEGLPYPFFIKFDDVEYGMRRPSHVKIITANGVAVRHEAFDKKTSLILDYYNLRNELTVNAIYQSMGALGALKRYLREVAKQLVLYRYDNLPLVRQAVKDFLGGTDFFLGYDAEEGHRRLSAMAPRLVSLSDLPDFREERRQDDLTKQNRPTLFMLLTLGGHLLPRFLLKKESVAAPLSRVSAATVFRRRRVIQYQLGTDMGLVTERSLWKFLRHGTAALFTAVRLAFGYRRAARSLRHSGRILTTRAFWTRALAVSEQDNEKSE